MGSVRIDFMPELPEVETIKLSLQKKIVGLIIKDIHVLAPKSFIGDPKEITGKKIENVWRRGKVLGIELASVVPSQTRNLKIKKIKSGDSSLIVQNDRYVTLLFHLKMTGQLIYDDGKRFIGGHPTPDMVGEMSNSHTRVMFELVKQETGSKRQEESYLFFNDQRKFGWIKVIENLKLKIENSLIKLGPEPLEKEFSWQILKQNLLKHKNTAVKVALMDQSVVAGVGNIYASEACFDAKINPRTNVKDLSDEQFKKLYKGIVKSLEDGIKYGGATRSHFVDSDGHKGYFLDYAYVYGRDKHPCKVCKTEIKKIRLGGRGTFFCAHCQV